MADTSDIYDLFFPSPPALKELASISVTLDLWRQEINIHRTENKLAYLDLKSNRPQPLTDLIPVIPSAILSYIEKYITITGSAIDHWLEDQFGNRVSGLKILANFVDFVCDFDGRIDFGRTAKRMIQCDGISDDMKFHIACFYCFEEDILRLWPEVKSRISVNKIPLDVLPQNFYWICRLKNQMYKMSLPPLDGREFSFDEAVLYYLGRNVKCNWPALQYFLCRVDFDAWLRNILIRHQSCMHINRYPIILSRYILAKLNAENFQFIVNAVGTALMTGLSEAGPYGLAATWALIKNEISERGFNAIICQVVEEQNKTTFRSKFGHWWCEVWNGAPNRLKESFHVTSFSIFTNQYFYRHCHRDVSLLLAVLSDQSVTNREIFWTRYWRDLITGIKIEDLRCMMELCLSDENEITRFKNDVMSNFANIRSPCFLLLQQGEFSELDELINFCCPNKSAAKKIRQNSLRNKFYVNEKHIAEAKLFSQFVNDAFLNPVKFKNEILTSNGSKEAIRKCISSGKFLCVKEFVDLFASSQEAVTRIKRENIVPIIRQHLQNGPYCETCDSWSIFMKWLLEEDEEIERYKHELNIDTLIQTRIRIEMCKETIEEWEHVNSYDLFGYPVDKSRKTYDCVLDKFLEWYFVTSEALEEFKNKYAHDDVFMSLISKSNF